MIRVQGLPPQQTITNRVWMQRKASTSSRHSVEKVGGVVEGAKPGSRKARGTNQGRPFQGCMAVSAEGRAFDAFG